MPETMKEPCSQCPYRRKSMPGYLGQATPEEFMQSTMLDYPMPCHKTIDYNDQHWKDKWENLVLDDELKVGKAGCDTKEKHCAGAAIFFTNIAKLSRDAARPRMAADRELVFDHPQQFIDHHYSSGVGSWPEPTKK